MRASLEVVPGLEEIDALAAHEVDQTMFLSDAPRPDVRAEVPERLRLTRTGEGRAHDLFDQGPDSARYPRLLPRPPSEILADSGWKTASRSLSLNPP